SLTRHFFHAFFLRPQSTAVLPLLPRGYTFKAGSYIYVNCPAIDRAEWHPFSLIPVP
ncbi:unnamed protein product, partial [Ectocarpus sp. 12 AP-2014]